MKRILLPVAAVAALASLVVSGYMNAPSASAHERRTVAGKYNFVVGFDVEPVYLEEANGVLVRVSDAQTNQPVEGVEKTMKVDVTAGGQTKTLALQPRRNELGTYTAAVVPTKGGSWVFRFNGDINGTPIDEKFESGPGRFDEPKPKAEIAFPVSVPTNLELASQVQGSAGRTDAAAAPAAGADASEVQKALDDAKTARNLAIGFGIAGIAVGVVGIVLALSARSGRGAGRASEPI